MKSIISITDVNLAFVASMAEQFIDDPRAVPESWRSLFEALGREDMAELVGGESAAAWEARRQVRVHGAAATLAPVQAVDAMAGWAAAEQLRLDHAVRELVGKYRQHGHLHASISPLEAETAQALHFDLGEVGLTAGDLDRTAFCGELPLGEQARVRDIVGLLEATYCGTIGAEIAQIEDVDERRWWQARLEGRLARPETDGEARRWILRKLTEAAQLEQFLGRKFIGSKRFSVEGLESIIPMLHLMIETCGAHGVGELVLGMAHRGRLSVLINVLGQTLQDLFVAFRDADAVTQLGGGDVKYHMGRSCDIATPSGQSVHLTLCFNPSHLEFVNPVAEGRVRAKQDRLGDQEGQRIVPLLIHGDAAVIGQGVVPETLNLSLLEGYQTGGTIHIVLNNQVGFTTDPRDSRSTRYCTDIAKVIGCPVLHVNAEDLDAVAFASRTAVAYRQQFKRDIFIDLVAYRRHGHNEGDEPRFTQPQMYQVIDNKRSIRELYRDQLIAQGDLTPEGDATIVSEVNDVMEMALETITASTPFPKPASGDGLWTGYKGGYDIDVPRVATGLPVATLSAWLERLATPPAWFSPHRKLTRLLDQRRSIARGEEPVDWAAAEHLALASLLAEGHPIRMTGQDVRRGTFAHRHAVLADPDTGKTWTALEDLAARPGLLRMYNSPLSETAVLGFEFGYSLDCPDGLVVWEAQFGDFANGAQVIIDQFISSTEDKWRRLSGLVLLLPHGFEGQGPEHSSARLERFLQQCAEDNMQVVNLTTPAQLFHVLRRQVVRPLRKPLIVMSPKSLLRHRMVRSSLEELAEGGFKRIIPDELARPVAEIHRVLLCSGRVYFDLAAEREQRGANDVAILRFEQLYPLPRAEIQEALGGYAAVDASFHWVQDEPWNMGAWHFIQARVRDALGRAFPVNCISRAESASPATGSHASHKYEHERLIALAFGTHTEALGSVDEAEV